MSILIDRVDFSKLPPLEQEKETVLLLNKKMDADEKIVRKTLVKEWIRVLEKYARPGVPLPSPEGLRRELLAAGLDAAVDAVVDEHWFVFTWMIRDRIRDKVEEGLRRCDLADFIEDVRVAQKEPGMIPYLRTKIKRYVMEEF